METGGERTTLTNDHVRPKLNTHSARLTVHSSDWRGNTRYTPPLHNIIPNITSINISILSLLINMTGLKMKIIKSLISLFVAHLYFS